MTTRSRLTARQWQPSLTTLAWRVPPRANHGDEQLTQQLASGALARLPHSIGRLAARPAEDSSTPAHTRQATGLMSALDILLARPATTVRLQVTYISRHEKRIAAPAGFALYSEAHYKCHAGCTAGVARPARSARRVPGGGCRAAACSRQLVGARCSCHMPSRAPRAAGSCLWQRICRRTALAQHTRTHQGRTRNKPAQLPPRGPCRVGTGTHASATGCAQGRWPAAPLPGYGA